MGVFSMPRPVSGWGALLLMLGAWAPLWAADGGGHEGHRHHGGGAPAVAAGTPIPAWTTQPRLRSDPRGGRGRVVVRPLGLNPERVTLHSPESPGLAIPMSLEGGKAVQPVEGGNYHWVVARQVGEGKVITAATAAYVSNPGPAPGKLLEMARPGLEVAPLRLPREHSSYRAGESWPFQVRLDGQPLAGASVRLESEPGEEATYTTDALGRFSVRFPSRFKERAEGGHGRAPQTEFVLSVTHGAGAVEHLSTFSYTYAAPAYHDRHVWSGVGFMVLGMVVALPLLRRKGGEA